MNAVNPGDAQSTGVAPLRTVFKGFPKPPVKKLFLWTRKEIPGVKPSGMCHPESRGPRGYCPGERKKGLWGKRPKEGGAPGKWIAGAEIRENGPKSNGSNPWNPWSPKGFFPLSCEKRSFCGTPKRIPGVKTPGMDQEAEPRKMWPKNPNRGPTPLETLWNSKGVSGSLKIPKNLWFFNEKKPLNKRGVRTQRPPG